MRFDLRKLYENMELAFGVLASISLSATAEVTIIIGTGYIIFSSIRN